MAKTKKVSRTEMKAEAQFRIMTGIANEIGYWAETATAENLDKFDNDEFREILNREADRVAKIMGFEKAWVN